MLCPDEGRALWRRGVIQRICSILEKNPDFKKRENMHVEGVYLND